MTMKKITRTKATDISRRKFIVGTAAAGGGLALGFKLPFIGSAQLVAEELECDWKKVATEHVFPGQNLARKRVWGDMATGGSRGIRGSQDYVRRGGAAARMMLVQAAAEQWKVPA